MTSSFSNSRGAGELPQVAPSSGRQVMICFLQNICAAQRRSYRMRLLFSIKHSLKVLLTSLALASGGVPVVNKGIQLKMLQLRLDTFYLR